MNRDQPSHQWLRERAEAFVALVGERGMVMTVDAAEVLIADRTSVVAHDLGITTKNAQLYLDDVVLSGLADAVIASLGDEEPGMDPLDAARTATVSVADFGRLIAGLAESVLLYTDSPALDVNDRPLRHQELTRLISVCGLIQSEHVTGEIPVPPALLARMARALDTAAGHAAAPELATALRADAQRARTAQTGQ